MIILLPLLICIIGLLVYALSTNSKVAELGRLSFWVGLLVFLLHVSSETIGALGK